MEKNNGKVIAIVALFVAVVALSIGFAAFTDTLTINGTATVKQGSNSAFAASFAYDSTSEEQCTLTGGGALEGGTYSAGTSSDNTWSGISVPLDSTTAANASVTCTARVVNSSVYDAYLRTISVSGPIECSTGTGDAAATNTSDVCDHVTATVQVGNASNSLAITTSSTSSTANSNVNYSVPASGNATVTVIIAYDTTAGVVPDGDVTVTLPTISHGYSTVAPASSSS